METDHCKQSEKTAHCGMGSISWVILTDRVCGRAIFVSRQAMVEFAVMHHAVQTICLRLRVWHGSYRFGVGSGKAFALFRPMPR